MNWLLDRTQRAAEFETLGCVLDSTPVRRIVPSEDPADIGALCALILDDAAQFLGASQPVAGLPHH
jgi:hypothetical protein